MGCGYGACGPLGIGLFKPVGEGGRSAWQRLAPDVSGYRVAFYYIENEREFFYTTQ